MVVLALETVTRAGSVALATAAGVHAVDGRSGAHARRAAAAATLVDLLAATRPPDRRRRSLRRHRRARIVHRTARRHRRDAGPRAGHRQSDRRRSRRSTRSRSDGRVRTRSTTPPSSSRASTASAARSSARRGTCQATARSIARASMLAPRAGRPDDLAGELRRWADRAVHVVGERRRDGTRTCSPPPARTSTIDRESVTLAETAALVARRRSRPCGRAARAAADLLRRPDAELARERAPAVASAITPEDGRTTGADYVVSRAQATDDLADVESLQRRTFTNPWAVRRDPLGAREHRRRASLRHARPRG